MYLVLGPSSQLNHRFLDNLLSISAVISNNNITFEKWLQYFVGLKNPWYCHCVCVCVRMCLVLEQSYNTKETEILTL